MVETLYLLTVIYILFYALIAITIIAFALLIITTKFISKSKNQ